MEPVVDKEFSALGGLFQHIITDLKNSAPVWEDFLMKATKLQSQLKATISSSTSFLDSFQKIADMATNTRGATKEIGTALTRLCLRQRSVEARLKIFSNSLQESLVVPLQEKLEEWKKMTNYLDKEHAKEYKRAKQELKKKSSDTLRLQKKVRKVGVCDIRRTLDYALQDVTDKYLLLEETEKQSVRKALIEERSHFCFFVGYLQPVLESELTMLHEVSHIQEIVDTLGTITGDPHLLPSTSEQVISDLKGSENAWSYQQTPPSSPGSLGSRKSSVCSISSINSSSSGSLKSSHSKQLSHFQTTLRNRHLTSVASQDSGFTSQDTLYTNYASMPLEISHQLSTFSEMGSTTLSTPSSPVPSVTSTWPNLQDTVQYEKQPSILLKHQRPHTISSAYEKSNHSRPALTAHTFQPLDHNLESKSENSDVRILCNRLMQQRNYNSQPGTPVYSRPSIPERNEDVSKSRPSIPEKSASVKAKHVQTLLQYGAPNRSLPDFNKTPPDQVVPHPVYANTSELAARAGIATKEDNGSGSDGDKALQNRRNLAAVLTEGLLLQSMRPDSGDDLSSSPPNVPVRPKMGRPMVGGSETLPRSRGSVCDEDILRWQMNALAFVNGYNNACLEGVQRRPMSVAGISPGFLLPRKASTLQRVGSSSGSKPPTPVRRSSSITSSSSSMTLPRTSNGNLSNRKNDSLISSGGGEVRYSPDLTELCKNAPEGGHCSPQEKSHSLKHANPERDYESISNIPPVNGSDNELENNIVTDVSGSRARLIHDLNFSLTQQRKLLERKTSLSESPPTPPRHSSKHNRNEHSKQVPQDVCSATNSIYGVLPDRSSHSSPSKQLLRKSSLLETSPLASSNMGLKEGPNVPQRRSSQVLHSSPPAGITSNKLPNDKSLKQCFMVALNAKLAQQHHTKAEEEKQSLSQWQIRNSRNQSIDGWLPVNQHPYRESLMDQIKQGKHLKKVFCNDRSSPRLA